MWSKSKLKFVRSLSQKKWRDAEGAFVAEGPKAVGELAERFSCRLLAATADYLDHFKVLQAREVVTLTPRELQHASGLSTSHEVLAVFDKPTPCDNFRIATDRLTLVLDGVQDPGNLGTIIRTADWFGISDVVCSRDTADAYSPKVVQATMGALARVRVVQADLPELLSTLPDDFPVYGTFMEGVDMYRQTLPAHAVLVMGNEGNGISPVVAEHVSHKLHIPNYPVGRHTVESLNVAVATAVVCAEFRRQAGL